LYLDTKDGSYKLVKCKQKLDFKICLIYSGVSRKLRNTLYNVRVDECKTTAFLMNSIMQNTPIEFTDAYLRNFSYDDFEKNKYLFPVNHIKRATHFYSEMKRVEEGASYFLNGDLTSFGKLMFESGTSSIENYETGSEQLEKLHNILKRTKGVYGGRFSGAGFNGYYVATKEYLTFYPQYKEDFKMYFCNIEDGVRL
jgi:galactokinase